MAKIVESGIIGEDGRLWLPMDRLNMFFREHRGRRIVVTFEAITTRATVAQQSYYYGYVLPTVCAAMAAHGVLMREDAADEFLLEQYPGELTREEDGAPVRQARRLQSDAMTEFLRWLHQFAAENLHVYVEDPKFI